MLWEWTPWALFGLVPLLVGLPMAIFVYLARPGNWQNRWLALLLVADSVFVGLYWGVMAFVTDPRLAHALGMTGFFLAFHAPILYLLFLATLPAPLARPLATRTGRGVLLAGLVATTVLFFLFRYRMIDGVVPDPKPYFSQWIFAFQPGFMVFNLVSLLSLLFGLAVAISLFLATPRSSPRRPAAVAYLLAFGIRDASTIGALGALALSGAAPVPGSLLGILATFATPVGLTLFILLMGYGILKTHLFDIDLKIKWTIKKSTLIGVFVGVFFVSAQVAQAFLTTEYGWAFGGVVAGLLLLAINPLQRVAGRVADAAMPGVQDTEGYRIVRKSAVYQATLEEMLADGSVTAKERRTLVRLQEQLGLTAAEAQRLELGLIDQMPRRGAQ